MSSIKNYFWKQKKKKTKKKVTKQVLRMSSSFFNWIAHLVKSLNILWLEEDCNRHSLLNNLTNKSYLFLYRQKNKFHFLSYLVYYGNEKSNYQYIYFIFYFFLPSVKTLVFFFFFINKMTTCEDLKLKVLEFGVGVLPSFCLT